MPIDIGARTDVGAVRQLNEDCFRFDPDLSLFVLSDGIGGHAHGEVASAIAVDTVIEYCQGAARDGALAYEGEPRPDLSEKTNRLASAIRRANRIVRQEAAADEARRGMGATIVAVWIDNDRLSLAHVGDSRAYRFRENSYERLTRDHSLVAEQVRLGMMTEEQAEKSDLQTVLIRALGGEDEVEVDVDEHLLMSGDTILLCSDGLSRMVPDDVIAAAICNASDSQAAVDQLIDLANKAGGADNITAIVLRYEAKSPSFLDKILPWRR